MAIKPLVGEREIINQVSMGSQKAFTKLFDAYYQDLGKYIYLLTDSVEVSEEIVQDIFMKLWENREQLVHIENLKNYLFIATRNKTYNYIRQQASIRIKQQQWEQQTINDLQAIEDNDFHDGCHVLLDKYIDKLPPRQKKVYLLSRVDRLKPVEIGQLLDISPETAKKHIKLALKYLKSQLSTAKIELILICMASKLFF